MKILTVFDINFGGLLQFNRRRTAPPHSQDGPTIRVSFWEATKTRGFSYARVCAGYSGCELIEATLRGLGSYRQKTAGTGLRTPQLCG